MRAYLVTCSFLLLILAGTSLQAQQEKEYLTILNLNDTHANLLPGGPRDASGAAQVGGIARAATIIGQTRLAEENVLVLHGGDACIGDPMYNLPATTLYTSPEFQILDQLEIDAMACGNHEFDFGPDLLLGILSDTNPGFPLLSANISLQGSYPATLGQYIHPYTVINRGSFRVGVIGLTTPRTNIMLTPGGDVYFKGMDETEIAEIFSDLGALIATDLVPVQQCNVIVVLSHMGMELDKALAANVPGINLIVSAHDHIATRKPVKVMNKLTHEDVSIVQTAGFYRQIGNVQLELHNGKIDVVQYDIVELDASVPENPLIAAAVGQVQDQIVSVIGPDMFETPVGYCSALFTELATDLTNPGPHDTHVGNLVADAFKSLPGVDIGIEPGGSTAQPLYPGPILPLDIYRMIGYGAYEEDPEDPNDPDSNPLGYAVVVFSIQGKDLRAGLEATLADIETDDEMLLQVSGGMQYFYDPQAEIGQRVKGILYQGQQMNMESTFTVATNYLVLMYLDMLGITHGPATVIANPSTGRALSEFELVTQYVGLGLEGQLDCGAKPGRIQAICSAVIPPPTVIQSIAKINGNSPNPFHGETSVSFTLTADAPVTVKVYDTVGREIATLHEGFSTAGTHTVTFNGANLPPGIYFCRLFTAEGLAQTLKIMKTR